MDEALKEQIKAKMHALSQSFDSLLSEAQDSERAFKAEQARHQEFTARAEKQLAEFRGAYKALEWLLAEAKEGETGGTGQDASIEQFVEGH